MHIKNVSYMCMLCVGNVANRIVECAELLHFTRSDHKRHILEQLLQGEYLSLIEERVEEIVDEVLPVWRIT